MMILSIVVCIPLAIYFAHYHTRGELFQAHYWINSLGTVGLAVIGFGLAAGYHSATQTANFSSVHSILGVVVIAWLVCQLIGGTVLHYFFDERVRKAGGSLGLSSWFHYISGVLVFVLGAASVGLGIYNYGTW